MTDEELIDLIEKYYMFELCMTSSMFDCSIEDIENNPVTNFVENDELPI